MRKRLVVVGVMAAILSLVIAVPVSAKKPLIGEMDLLFNLGFPSEQNPDGRGPCPQYTWAGSVVFDGFEFGLAYIPSAPPREVGQAFHFTDKWMVTLEPFTFEDGIITDCDSPIALYGYDKGVQSNKNLKAHANGFVEEGELPGFFAERLEGRRVHWSGVTSFTEEGITFEGPFRIN